MLFKQKINFGGALIASALSGFPGGAFASSDSGDTAWMLTSTALVVFMTIPGLALLRRARAFEKRAFSPHAVLCAGLRNKYLMDRVWVLARIQ